MRTVNAAHFLLFMSRCKFPYIYTMRLAERAGCVGLMDE